MQRIVAGKTAWRVHPSASAGLLIDARDYYAAFHEVASQARRSILLVGWQFDSDVQLLRGDDVPAGVHGRGSALLALLDRLCRQRPGLEVRILAWEHSVFFSLEREILQKVVFDIATVERFHFQTDGTVPLGGSHHQKIAIVDGRLGFMGSADICHDRWDTSAHLARDPRRVARNHQAYKPCHEVQAVFSGAPVRSLMDLFGERWRYATGERLDLARLVADGPEHASLPRVSVPMPVADVALSRTVPGGPGRPHIHEIRDLYVRAIRGARRLIYVETQYLTSCCVRDAFLARLRQADLPRLEVVLLLPSKPESLKEELAIGAAQAGVLDAIAEAAREGGHALGIYNVAPPEADGARAPPVFVYIHAKLMIVDDELLTLGSANLANRSMTVDSEINATWAAEPGQRELRRAIRRVRVRLLLEHLGEGAAVRVVARPEGLVARLDRTILEGKGRLRHHDPRREEPSPIARAVQELAGDYVDPADGGEPPPSSLGPRTA